MSPAVMAPPLAQSYNAGSDGAGSDGAGSGGQVDANFYLRSFNGGIDDSSQSNSFYLLIRTDVTDVQRRGFRPKQHRSIRSDRYNKTKTKIGAGCGFGSHD